MTIDTDKTTQKQSGAVIWWRVSTADQLELSPETQIAACRDLAEKDGYHVPDDCVIGSDWGSLTVWDSPPMQELKERIADGSAKKVYSYDPDRLPSKPVHRMMFRAMVQEFGVTVRCVHGEVPTGDMGEVMEFLTAWQKEKQVLRARQGAKDGMRDRAALRGLPASPRKPYGYTWNAERTALIPDDNHIVAKKIVRWSYDSGWSERRIVKELYTLGIPSPTGRPVWSQPVIRHLLANPLYGGRYYALRSEAIEPVKRLSDSAYGKTSKRNKTLENSIYVSNITIHDPPLNWSEWERLQERRAKNKLMASRNATRTYLLRGLVYCGTHRRRFQGRKHRGGWHYVCPDAYAIGGHRCEVPYLHGPWLEERAKAECRRILLEDYVVKGQVLRQIGTFQTTQDSLTADLRRLERKARDNLSAETQLALELARGRVSGEAYDRALALLAGERTWVAEETERIRAELKAMNESQAALQGIEELREELKGRLESATDEDWLHIFKALDVQIHVKEDGEIYASFHIPFGHVRFDKADDWPPDADDIASAARIPKLPIVINKGELICTVNN